MSHLKMFRAYIETLGFQSEFSFGDPVPRGMLQTRKIVLIIHFVPIKYVLKVDKMNYVKKL